jgi:putative DNA primase/helicase
MLSKLIQNLPNDWRLVAVGDNKGPYQKSWQKKRLTKEDIELELSRPVTKCKAVGVLCGEPSNGLLVVDVDGESASELLKEKFDIEELPKTLFVTSGRRGRFSAFYKVDKKYWNDIQTTKLGTGKKGDDNKQEHLELRWSGTQSIAVGFHPMTGSYQWVDGQGPAEVAIATAPQALVDAMSKESQTSVKPATHQSELAQTNNKSNTVEIIPLTALLSREHRDWIKDGVAEGGRNDSAFRLAVDLLGVAEWANVKGIRTEGNPINLFDDFVLRCSPPLSEVEAKRTWHSAIKQNPRPCLSDDKLENCVAALQKRHNFQRLLGGKKDIPNVKNEEVIADDQVFVCLGYHKETYFYLPRGQKQVIALTAAKHTERHLLSIAPKIWWTRHFPKPNQKTGEINIDWSDALDFLYQKSHEQGVYDPSRIRGRGLWIDGDRIVCHLGDRIYLGDKKYEVGGFKSEFIYERGPRLIGPSEEPLTTEEARYLIDTAKLMRWEQPASAALLCGWIVLAPICGALRWRPHTWLVGGAGSGKSTVLSDFVKPLLGGFITFALGSSTEAGLRQHLQSDAIPLVIDEAENANAFTDENRIQGILELARLSSSETDGAKTFKGSSSGASNEYQIRSAFLLSSITSSLKQGSDKTRFALLQLQGHETTDIADHWKDLKPRLAKVNTEMGRRLLARSVQLLPTIRKNVETFSIAASKRLSSQRLGDQFGFLLAGAFSLISDEEATEEMAGKFFEAFQLDEHLEPSRASADHQRLFDTLLTTPAKLPSLPDTSLGVLIDIVRGKEHSANITQNIAHDYLQNVGLKIEEGIGKPTTLLVSNTHPGLKRILKGTPWSNDWRTVLKQRKEAFVTKSAKYFKGGHNSKCVALPL